MAQMFSTQQGPFEPYLDAQRASEYIGISAKKLLQLARTRKVPAYGIGDGRRKMWRFRRSELDIWLHGTVHSSQRPGPFSGKDGVS